MSDELKIDHVGPTPEQALMVMTRTSDGLDGSDGGGELVQLARTLAAYALNLAYGGRLEPFELEHLTALAKRAGCVVAPHHLASLTTRRVLNELMTERQKQIVMGYTAEYDDAHPMHARMETLNRLNDPNYTRVQLIEAATIVVAEIERVDRETARVGSPMEEDPVEVMESILESRGIPT